MPRDLIGDLWGVRDCFHRHFQRPLHFIVAEDENGPAGFMPLSWIEEKECFGYFPGETWQGKTWLEQNRLIARDEATLSVLLEGIPRPYHLRYLLPVEPAPQSTHIVDEIGYLFNPPDFDYNFDNYYHRFSHKSEKRLKKELAAFDTRGVEYRLDRMEDFDLMVEMNLGRFGIGSYFYDNRFRESFRSLAHYLADQGWLRLTTVLIEGRPAAVDMGVIYNGIYTLLGGGTSADFPGVAKLINTFHMQRACRERLRQADFLCGDFSWKGIFHLSTRPLYLLSNVPVTSELWRQDTAHNASITFAGLPGGLSFRTGR